MVVITEFFLYVSFSLLMGGLIVESLPSEKVPDLSIPKKLLLTCVVFITVLSFVPVLEIIIFLAGDIGGWKAFSLVVLTYEIGKVWLVTVTISILLFCLIYFIKGNRKKMVSRMGILLTIVLTITLGWASHAASISQWYGFLADTFHFLAIAVWAGVVLVVGWFSTSEDKWFRFLKWFTPLAISCVSIIIAAGLVLMELIVESGYLLSWLVPYGQALLIKHLLIIPLLTYGFINGFLMKSRIKKDPSFSPKKWLKVEGIMMLLVFLVTAFMGQQNPPDDVSVLLKNAGSSPWFQAFFQGIHSPNMDVILDFGTLSLMFILLAFFFLSLVVLTFLKQTQSLISLGFSILFVVSSYIGLIIAIHKI